MPFSHHTLTDTPNPLKLLCLYYFPIHYIILLFTVLNFTLPPPPNQSPVRAGISDPLMCPSMLSVAVLGQRPDDLRVNVVGSRLEWNMSWVLIIPMASDISPFN